MKQNNEKKSRQHVKDRKIGEAKIMGYEEIIEALRTRDRKEAEKQKAAQKATSKVSKPQATGSRSKTQRMAAGEVTTEVAEMSTYCSVFPVEPANQVYNTEELVQTFEISSGIVWPVEKPSQVVPFRAPVARMY